MMIWNFKVTTPDGLRAAQLHGLIGCAVFGVQAVLGIALLSGAAGLTSSQSISVVVGAGIELAVAVITGLRLWQGKGAYWGMALAVLISLELIGKAVQVSVVGLLIGSAVLVLLLSGIRGALAAKRNAAPG